MTSDPEDRDDAEALAELVAHLAGMRRHLEIPQQEVARYMGITQTTVSTLERGRGPLRLSTLQAYARALGARLRVHIDFMVDPDAPDTAPEDR